jgi:hypothetical protein
MTSTLSPSFLRTVVVMTGFKPNLMRRVQAALLMMAMQCEEVTAAQIPPEITEGNRHIAGAATGSLIAEGLLTVIGRVKSPNPDAKGRKLDVVRLVSVEKAKTWLRANGFKLEPAVATSRTEGELFNWSEHLVEAPG